MIASRPVLLSVAVALLLIAAHPTSAGEHWPQFRGPDATGVPANGRPPETWSATANVLWKQPVSGRGWSSPIVWGDRIFLMTVESEGELERQQRGLYLGGERRDPPDAVHHWKVLCLDLATGQPIWQRTVHQGVPKTSIHLKNTYASETPVTDGQRVYAYFGNVGVFCLDFEGEVLWSRSLGTYPMTSGWGTGASPTLHGDTLYIQNDNEENSFLVALDTKTGDERWRTQRDDRSNWATPFVWENDVRTEIVASGTNNVRGYDLSGKPLWELHDMSHNAIPTPFAKHGLLYVASGHVLGNKKWLVAVKPGAAGDITPQGDETSSQYVAWRQKGAAPYNPSPLVYGDYAYVLLDAGFLACYDARTGEVAYSKQRLPDGRAFTASPWAYRDRIFCLNEFGVTFVIEAGPKFEILRKNTLDEDAMCLATPAIVGDKLLIRTDATLYCLQDEESVASNAQP